MSNQLLALALTLMLEVPVAWRGFGGAAAPLRVPGAAVLASVLSHPLAWSLALRLGPDDFPLGYWFIESGVWLFEAALYRGLLRCPWRQALAVSLAANLLSALAGGWLFAQYFRP